MKLVWVLLMLMSVSVFAKEGGNGGDVITCRYSNGEIASIELLDYYEARQMRKFTVVEYPNLSDDEFIEMIGNKINDMEDLSVPFDIKEAKSLMKSTREYLATGKTTVPGVLFTHEVLQDITDSEELFIPRGCNVEQIAIWQFQNFPEDPKFIIQADLLKGLSDRDVRGLVLHEMIYKTMYIRSFGPHLLKDSYSSRYLHEKIMSKDIKEFTFKDYFTFLRGLYYRQGTEKGYLKKGKFFLEILRSLPQHDALEISIDGTDVMIALNWDGKFDKKLNKKYGSLRIEPFYNMQLPGFNPGKLQVGPLDVNFVNDHTHYLGTRFEKTDMTVFLNPYHGSAPEGNYGFSYTGTDFKKKYMTIKAAPAQVPQVLTKRLLIDFDMDSGLIVKEVQ